jgi:DNA-binding beta-propeller fold protein YncE
MKTRFKSSIHAVYHSFGGAVCAGAVLLIASSGQAQNLFVGDNESEKIYEYTPGGVRSTFASGFNNPQGMAFNSAGDLFVANWDRGTASETGTITEITPGGVQSTFASGLAYPTGLAFNSAGDLFVADWASENIYEFTPGGVRSTFAFQSSPTCLAFQGETLPVPEPSVLGLLAVGMIGITLLRRHQR